MDNSDLGASSGKFAWLTAPGAHVRPAYDIVVASNDHFVAVPSLGSIVPHWLLLVPRRPIPTLSLLNAQERAALVALRSDLTVRIRELGKTVYAFEHGGALGSLVSCGVDQAHLHLVPLGFDLLNSARRYDLEWQPSGSICDLTEADTDGREYLFAERDGASLIGFPKEPTSQWFRQLIAQECGVKEWDYKKTPNLNQIISTAEDLQKLM